MCTSYTFNMMLKYFAVVAVLFLSAKAYEYENVRIVNGTDAEEGEFKFAVSLRIQKNEGPSHTCGGTILNERHVLTAAHCACDDNKPQDPALYSIQYGSIYIDNSLNRSIQVSNISCGNFSMETITNDVSVLTLESALPNDGTWEPVTLATQYNTSESAKEAAIIGWGRTSQDGPLPDCLQKLDVTVYNDMICETNDMFQVEHHICFGAPVGGACNGDSGTALLSKIGEQIGIASFITAPCGVATPSTPNVYSRITTYLEWIEEHSRLDLN